MTIVPRAFLVSLMLLTGCVSPPPAPLQLYKSGASYQEFSSDRYSCIREAQQRVSGASVNAYGGVSESRVLPSRGIYLNCMAARGYYPVESGGFVPAALVPMVP